MSTEYNRNGRGKALQPATGADNQAPHRPLTPKTVAAIEYWVQHPTLALSEVARRCGVNRCNLSKAVHHHPDAAAVVRRTIGNRLATFGAVMAASTLQDLIERGQSEYVRLDASKHMLAVNGVSPSRAGEQAGAGGIQINIFAPGGRLVRFDQGGNVIDAEPAAPALPAPTLLSTRDRRILDANSDPIPEPIEAPR